MNRRQEVATWIFGVLLAFGSWIRGADNGIWTLEIFVPLTVLGTLFVFSLRTRERATPGSQNSDASTRALKVGGAALLAAVAINQAAWAIDRATPEIDFGPVYDVESGINGLESKIDSLEYDVESLESTVRSDCCSG
jgi:hypothetical protein